MRSGRLPAIKFSRQMTQRYRSESWQCKMMQSWQMRDNGKRFTAAGCAGHTVAIESNGSVTLASFQFLCKSNSSTMFPSDPENWPNIPLLYAMRGDSMGNAFLMRSGIKEEKVNWHFRDSRSLSAELISHKRISSPKIGLVCYLLQGAANVKISFLEITASHENGDNLMFAVLSGKLWLQRQYKKQLDVLIR